MDPVRLKKKAVIVGAYGCGNVGDDAILAGLLKRFDPDKWELSVLSAETPGISNIAHVRLIRQQLNRGLTWDVLRRFEYGAILSAIRRADLLIIGGGALLHDLRPYNLPYFFLMQTWAMCWRTRVIYMDIGAGPVRTSLGRWLCRRFLPHAAAVSVRDIEGKRCLESAGVKRDIQVTADPAFMLTPEDVHAASVEKAIKQENLPEKFVAMTVCGWFKSEDFWKRKKLDQSGNIRSLAAISDTIIEKSDLPVVFFPTVVPFDRETAGRIQKEMRYRDRFQWLERDYPVEILMGLFGRASWLFGMRLHSMILCTIMQVPFFSMIYDRKVTHFMNAIGNPHHVMLENRDMDTLTQKLDAFIQDMPALKRQIRDCPDVFRKRLVTHFRHLEQQVL